MNSEITIKQNIENALNNFLDDQQSLRDAATELLNTLSYHSGFVSSDEIDKPRYDRIKAAAEKTAKTSDRLRLEDWEPFSQVMQVTDADIKAQLITETTRFESKAIDNELRNSYMFIAMPLTGDAYTRTQLANIMRFMSMRIPQPFMVMFRYGSVLTLGIINRRQSKRDDKKQVLEKVTLIKDINLDDPKRAHIEIVYDLYLRNLINDKDRKVHNFDTLHDAWEVILNTEELNIRFYNELEAWYDWAITECKFPDKENKMQVIRMLTRILFIWFIKGKNLVPEDIFQEGGAIKYLNNFDFETSDYYQAILQNLFFATLNTPIKDREFRISNDTDATITEQDSYPEYNKDRRNSNKYRYEDLLQNPKGFLEHLKQVPFVNGGLFDSLDSFKGKKAGGKRVDCFTDWHNHRKQLHVPAKLFFEKDKGLYEIFENYKFTVEENTPVDQEVALDPELLGRVFEKLLAAINPETGETVRKMTGSYYTPRAIVDYMVEEALIATLAQKCQPTENNEEPWNKRLRHLFDYTHTYDDPKQRLDDSESKTVVRAISELKILDPAVGSGAFPMGMLHKLTLALRRLDPDNTRWEELQKELAGERAAAAFNTQNQQNRDTELTEISDTFERYRDSDFGRKLYLIQNSIFGVDIQPIACQIAKLRFFISLAIEQEPDTNVENFGIKPLPNLETHFLAANTLIGLKMQQSFMTATVGKLEKQLRDNREQHFHASTRQRKLYCKNRDEKLRAELATEFKSLGMFTDDAEKIAKWDLYDQNTTADWFDSELMFGLTHGFDVVIGNPPYIDSEMMTRTQPELREIYKTIYQSAKGNWDLFIIFIERGIQLQKESGVISYIVPNTLIGAAYSKALRKMLLNHSILEIRDYSKVDVFKESDVYPLVFVIRKSGQKPSVSMIVMDDFDRSSISNQVSAELFYRDIFWDRFFVPENQLQVIVKCLSFPVIDPFFQIGAAATVSEAYTLKEYIQEYSDELSEKPFKKLINTGTVDRYQSLWYKKPIKYIKDNYYVPIVLDSDLRQFSERRFSQAQSRKIIIGGMNKILECVFDEGEYIAGKSTTIVLENGRMNLKYALALLNSKLVSFWFRICYRSLALAGGYLRIGPNEIKTIPIPEVTLEQQTPIIELVDQILAAKAPDSDTDTSDLENEIDELVYALYDLTDDEIAIVEARE